MCGICNEAIRRRLLTEKTLTLTKAIEQALSMEAAERNAKSFSGNESSIKKLQIRSKQRTSQIACTRCGKTNNAAKDCKCKDATCHACGKKGHIAPVCSQDPHPQRTNRVIQQEEISSSSDSEEFYTLKLTTPATTTIEVTVQIEEKNLTLEIDTGAAVSITSAMVTNVLNYL